MRPHIRRFVEICVAELELPDPVVEIGAFQVEGQEAMADLRSLFPGAAYVGTDMRPGTGVDRIEDLHELTFADGEVGTYIVLDTMEHVRYPERAFAELRRTLAAGGVALISTVMHFPIHSHPEDYWRYTPELFRELTRQFPLSAVFFGGDPNFPHTVCAVVSTDQGREASFRALADKLAEAVVPDVPKMDRHAARLMRKLSLMVAGSSVAKASPGTDPAAAFEKPLAAPGWTLVSGMWIEGWSAIPGRVAVTANDVTLLEAELSPKRDGTHRFRQQVVLPSGADEVAAIEMVLLGAEPRVLCRSATGLIIRSLPRESGFALYSLEARPLVSAGPGAALDGRLEGRRLIADITARGDPVKVDLGCGFRKEGNIGIDATKEGTDADLVCVLGFAPLPLDDESVDEFYCRDFLEHLPKGVYLESRGEFYYPLIYLFNEIWRALKPGGRFVSLTPGYPEHEVHQDPTHLSVWTEKSFGYFTGDYRLASQVYGIECEFEKIDIHRDGFYIYAELRKPEAPAVGES